MITPVRSDKCASLGHVDRTVGETDKVTRSLKVTVSHKVTKGHLQGHYMSIILLSVAKTNEISRSLKK